MSAGAPLTHYEVYTLDDQRWILHAHFRADQRDAAVAEAKQVEKNLTIPAKVVREVYFPGSNSCEETVVYLSDKSVREAAANRAASRQRVAFARPDASVFGPSPTAMAQAAATRDAATKSLGLLMKLAIVIATSLAVAGAVAALFSVFSERLPEYGYHLTDEGRSLLLFFTFVMAFLVTAVPLAISIVNLEGARAKSKSSAEPRPPRPHAPPPKPAKPAAEPPAEDGEEEEDEEDLLPGDDLLLPQLAAAQETATAAVPDLPKAVETVAAEEPEKAEKEEAPDPMEALKMTMMRFLSALLSAVKKSRPQLDTYNKFGVDLALAGAIEVIGTQHNLSNIEKRKLLAQIIEVMGTKDDQAKAFSDKFENYLVEPRYMAMIQTGRGAMENFIAGAEDPAEGVPSAFEAWNKPASTQAEARIMTVLFTDMVGSTDLTQARGDHAAQDIVRRHNSIVRGALAEFSGKEVKHTGDGIMASFASAVSGVEAAIAIQAAVAAHNLKFRDQSLHLRIGMNAGEPIQEEDDLFGGTVQLAARVCAQCATDQILCTNVVRELAAGKSLTFLSQGAHDLKGFKDKIPLYEVQWKKVAAK